MSSLPERPRVLLVDDNAAVRQSLALAFSTLGWDITAVGDAEEAMVEMKKRRYDLAMIDLNMPRTSGLELCRLIQDEISPPRPVLFVLSGNISQADRDAALKIGIQAVLEKPLNLKELVETLKKHRLPCKNF